MDPLVKDYLRNHTFRQLEDDHGVNARPNALGDKFSLNYDQISAKSGDPLSGQCRGMVVRPHSKLELWNGRIGDGWKDVEIGKIDVLAWPMNRFYNHGDPAAAVIDWAHPSLKVYEKVDGTCIICYWDPLHERWHAATRSVPEADLPIQVGHLEIGDLTFGGLFLQALIATREHVSGQVVDRKCDGPDKVIHLSKELTYVFELVSPYNQVVVVYPEPRVYLLAARHTATGKEVTIESLRLQHVMRPRTWELNDPEKISAFVDAANPADLEGAVACVQVGDAFSREKIKNKTYVLAHRSKDTVMSSERNALECVLLEKVDDIVPLVPKEVGDKLLRMQHAFGQHCKQIDAQVAEFTAEAAGSRKRFAEQVNLCGDWTAPYFNLYERKAKDARDWFKTHCEKGKLSASSLDTILSKLTL